MRWFGPARWQRWMVLAALAQLLSGLLHVGGWWLDGCPALAGPLSWRKPIAFGFADGLLLLTVAWLMAYLPARCAPRTRRRAAVVGCVASLGITGIVVLQFWRGQPSHFNYATLLDNTLAKSMGVLVLGVLGVVLWLTRWSVRGLATTPSMNRAIQLGLAFLIGAHVVGIGIMVLGDLRVAAGAPITDALVQPGGVGDTRTLHLLAVDGLYVMAGLGWLVQRCAWSDRARLAAVHGAALAWAALCLLVGAQALRGIPTLDLSTVGWVWLAASVGALLATVGPAAAGAARRRVRA